LVFSLITSIPASLLASVRSLKEQNAYFQKAYDDIMMMMIIIIIIIIITNNNKTLHLCDVNVRHVKKRRDAYKIDGEARMEDICRYTLTQMAG
jgi:hypothetical protein